MLENITNRIWSLSTPPVATHRNEQRQSIHSYQNLADLKNAGVWPKITNFFQKSKTQSQACATWSDIPDPTSVFKNKPLTQLFGHDKEINALEKTITEFIKETKRILEDPTAKPNMQKGIVLVGDHGIGKTVLMRAIAKAILLEYQEKKIQIPGMMLTPDEKLKSIQPNPGFLEKLKKNMINPSTSFLKEHRYDLMMLAMEVASYYLLSDLTSTDNNVPEHCESMSGFDIKFGERVDEYHKLEDINIKKFVLDDLEQQGCKLTRNNDFMYSYIMVFLLGLGSELVGNALRYFRASNAEEDFSPKLLKSLNDIFCFVDYEATNETLRGQKSESSDKTNVQTHYSISDILKANFGVLAFENGENKEEGAQDTLDTIISQRELCYAGKTEFKLPIHLMLVESTNHVDQYADRQAQSDRYRFVHFSPIYESTENNKKHFLLHLKYHCQELLPDMKWSDQALHWFVKQLEVQNLFQDLDREKLDQNTRDKLFAVQQRNGHFFYNRDIVNVLRNVSDALKVCPANNQTVTKGLIQDIWNQYMTPDRLANLTKVVIENSKV